MRLSKSTMVFALSSMDFLAFYSVPAFFKVVAATASQGAVSAALVPPVRLPPKLGSVQIPGSLVAHQFVLALPQLVLRNVG